MTPTQRITILLHHYRTVCEGIYENPRGEDDVGRFLMCKTWRHPAYQELERLLTLMLERHPRYRSALRSRFERYSEIRVAWCRRCGNWPVAQVGRVHSHKPGRAVTLQPRLVRVWPCDHEEREIVGAIAWLALHWQATPQLPKVIAEMEAEQALRQAA